MAAEVPEAVIEAQHRVPPAQGSTGEWIEGPDERHGISRVAVWITYAAEVVVRSVGRPGVGRQRRSWLLEARACHAGAEAGDRFVSSPGRSRSAGARSLCRG